MKLEYFLGAIILTSICFFISLIWDIPEKISNKIPNFIKSFTMIKTNILLKAISFMLLPSLVILGVILIGFFNWTNFVNFMTSDSGWAIFVRLLMIVLELVLVCIMYQYYDEKEKIEIVKKNLKENPFSNPVKKVRAGYEFNSMTGSNEAVLNFFETEDENTFIVKVGKDSKK